MKNLNTIVTSFATATLFTLVGMSTAFAADPDTNANPLLTTQLQLNAQYMAAAAVDENLIHVVTTINASLKKELLVELRNAHSLDAQLALSQSIKDDKITSSVSE